MNPQSSRSESVSPGVSSSVARQPSRSEGLPLVPCPECGVTVKKLVNRTPLNPERVFYRCPNKISRCTFWKWENEYLAYLRNANVVIPSIESELAEVIGTLESQLVRLIDELKKKSQDDDRQIEAIVASLDNINIKVHNHMYVIIALLVVVIAILIVFIGIQK
ncbi:hypothetical protein LUZ61_011501 [Rhynchospora tenuis]|uniref:GRF-type domain-containing protein n=1 Tax=Rhynchospora tenuis TaxID=198213 RepID=A0AAD6A148_9POAL|nr:hypothetical protein LUZ61_011501 [Rhynchospora tenuis]